MKYIVKNCPVYVLMRTATSGTYFNICGNAKGHIKCCNIDDCTIKQIVNLCNDVLEQETDPLNSSEMSFARKILQLLEIEEVNE